MLIYTFKRIIESLITLFVLISLTFFIMKIVPGGPFDQERALPEEVKANIAAQYHFDEPILKQYLRYLNQLLHGDLGPSFRYSGGKSVSEILFESFPYSVTVGFLALLISIVLGVPLGAAAAYKRGTWIDWFISFVSLSGISIPNFVFASLLILIFSTWLGVLPPALWEDWRSLVLPVVTLSVRPLALIVRMTRASFLEVLKEEYIRTAISKGLSINQILFKHALKNALVPLLTVLGPTTAAIITGSFVIEMIFALPGMGKYFISAVIDRDYTMIMGVTLFYGVLVLFTNLVVDLLYLWVDPRISFKKTE